MWKYLFGSKHGGSPYLSGNEAAVLGPFSGRYGPAPDRNVFLGSVQIFFIGLVGEYVLTINSRMMKRPLVVEEERLNFDTEENAEESL